jgi:hypothetical protein
MEDFSALFLKLTSQNIVTIGNTSYYLLLDNFPLITIANNTGSVSFNIQSPTVAVIQGQKDAFLQFIEFITSLITVPAYKVTDTIIDLDVMSLAYYHLLKNTLQGKVKVIFSSKTLSKNNTVKVVFPKEDLFSKQEISAFNTLDKKIYEIYGIHVLKNNMLTCSISRYSLNGTAVYDLRIFDPAISFMTTGYLQGISINTLIKLTVLLFVVEDSMFDERSFFALKKYI